ncbi:MAG: hypothetical protein ABIY58_11400 [Acidimicrobiales bacterium]
MGISASVRRAVAPAGAALNAKLEDLYRHITNEARDTRDGLARRLDDVGGEVRRIHDRVDPDMTTIAEAATLLQHVARRVERRLADLSVASGADRDLADLAASRAAVEVPFALAALGRAPAVGGVVAVGQLGLLALLTACAGRPTDLVGGGPCPHPDVRHVEAEAGWAGPGAPAALVVRSLDVVVDAAGIEALVASAAWARPTGRLVVVAPLGAGGLGAAIEPALTVLAQAGWGPAHRVTASVVGGRWRVADTAEAPSADGLVLVELSRAGAG